MSKVLLVLSVDWEGEDFSSLRDLYALRREIGEKIPLTHFICPAYFVKYPPASRIVGESIEPFDEVALHLHPLRELMGHFGIPFRKEHNFYRPKAGIIPDAIKRRLSGDRIIDDSASGRISKALPLHVYRSLHKRVPPIIKNIIRRPVTGRGVPLSVYSPGELTAMIRGSRELLEEQVGREVRGFRAGGNMASDDVFRILEELGFEYDASAFPPALLSRGYGQDGDGSGLDIHGEDNGLYRDYMLKLWGRDHQDEGFLANRLVHEALDEVAVNRGFIDGSTQPFRVGRLTEYPINGGMSDFAHERKTLLPLFERLLQRAEETGKQQVMSLGFHMEGDWRYKAPVMEFLSWLEKQYAGWYEFAVHGSGNRNQVQYA